MLLLFDIDGTLLQGAHVLHREALHVALLDVYGIASPSPVPASGRTDTAIARDMCARAGVDGAQFEARLHDYREACCRAYEERCPPSLAEHVAPGVPALLAGLGDQRLSLVTGNYEPIARLKLARAGIGAHFPAGQGAFGSDAEQREELPPIARGRAGDHPREDTVVIGDTPRDIACARADGLRVIAVATGPYAADELTGADAVATDARAIGELLDRLS